MQFGQKYCYEEGVESQYKRKNMKNTHLPRGHIDLFGPFWSVKSAWKDRAKPMDTIKKTGG